MNRCAQGDLRSSVLVSGAVRRRGIPFNRLWSKASCCGPDYATFSALTCRSSWPRWEAPPRPPSLPRRHRTTARSGSIGSLFRTSAAVKRDIDVVQQLTNRNYAVNHIPPTLDADAFRHTLAARPAVISFALGDPGDLARQARDAGAKVMIQVTTVAQAIEAAERGADVIIAQGGEAGGYGGSVSTMALVPQVVDAVSPIPVVAAGGIFDGRGIAAAFMLGAVGVNIGTRFLASREAPIDDAWKAAIAAAESEDAVKVDVLNDIQPLPGTGGYGTVLAFPAYALHGRVEQQARSGKPAARAALGRDPGKRPAPGDVTRCC